MNITVETAPLIAAFKRVIPHVSTPARNIPILESIRLEVRGKYLVLTATDRYTVGESRVLISGAAEPFTALVNAKRVKSILTLLKADLNTTVSVTDERVTVGGIDVTGEDVGTYPAVGRLWPDTLGDAVAGPLGFGPEHLKKLTSLAQTHADRKGAITFHREDDRGGKPVIALMGDHTRVLMMSRSSTDEGTEARWGDWA